VIGKHAKNANSTIAQADDFCAEAFRLMYFLLPGLRFQMQNWF
jgi:hypothetical protein